MPDTAATVQRVEWDAFVASLDWQQGEHVTLVGPTGLGKTHLALELLRYREDRDAHIAILANKPRDATMEKMQRRGYKIVSEWGRVPPRARRVVLWPRFRGPGDIPVQAATFREALGEIFSSQGWCVYVDEAPWFVDNLKLDDWLTVIWQQGRSLGLSLVTSMQRPRFVPLVAFSSATHLFLYRTSDAEDLKRLAGLGVADTTTIRTVVAGLDKFDVLYVNTRTGHLAVTRAPKR